MDLPQVVRARAQREALPEASGRGPFVRKQRGGGGPERPRRPGTLRVQLSLAMTGNGNVWQNAVAYQQKLASVIEFMTAFNVVEVAVNVEEVV